MFTVVLLLLCSCTGTVGDTQLVRGEDSVEAPELDAASVKLLHVVGKSARLDKIVNEWRGATMYSRGCSILEAGADKCPAKDQDRAVEQASDLGACLLCAGHHDPETDAPFGACHTLCRVKKLEFTSADRFGCTCAGEAFYWVRGRCPSEPCAKYGFTWVAGSTSGYWTVTD